MLHADSARNRLTGIGLVSLTYLLFTLLDGSAKWMVQTVPVLVVVWLRFVTHTLIASALLFPMRGMALVRTQHLRWHLLRGLMFVAMTGLNFWALQYLQLTVTASIFFLVPILVALLSAPLLGEKMDARRWAAIVAGFAGVLVVVRPGSEAFHPAILLSLVSRETAWQLRPILSQYGLFILVALFFLPIFGGQTIGGRVLIPIADAVFRVLVG